MTVLNPQQYPAIPCKWPQMLTTGKPVTAEQARDIIMKTNWSYGFIRDRFSNNSLTKYIHLDCIKKINDKLIAQYGEYSDVFRDVINSAEQEYYAFDMPSLLAEMVQKDIGNMSNELEYLTNDHIHSCFIYGNHGWCNPDGSIFFYDNIGKWPSTNEVLEEWELIASMFPYLDLTATILNGESCEKDTVPVMNFRVVNGTVSIMEPDLSVHSSKYLNEDLSLKQRPSSYSDDEIIEYFGKPIRESFINALNKLKDMPNFVDAFKDIEIN